MACNRGSGYSPVHRWPRKTPRAGLLSVMLQTVLHPMRRGLSSRTRRRPQGNPRRMHRMNRHRMRSTNRDPNLGTSPNSSTNRNTRIPHNSQRRTKTGRILYNLLSTPSHVRSRRGLLNMSNIKSIKSITRNTQSESRLACRAATQRLSFRYARLRRGRLCTHSLDASHDAGLSRTSSL